MYDQERSTDKENVSELNDSLFSRSVTSLTIDSINNTTQHTLAKGRHLLPLTNSHSKDNQRQRKKLLVECNLPLENEDEDVATNTPVMGHSFDNNNILSDIDVSPSSTIFEPYSPTTPQTPYLKEFHNNKPVIPNDSFMLDRFVLSPNVFHLELGDQIGKGGNAYVFSCKLYTVGEGTSSFTVAVKIPSAKNKRTHILKEAKFAMKLREYQDEWFANAGRIYPFIDIYGLYYMDKSMFPLFTSQEKYPCLIMKKMTTSLPNYLESKKLCTSLWWKLCQTLLDCLLILKNLNSVHCDLKTDNIMVYEYDLTASDILDNTIFKVIDFSSATDVGEITTVPDMTLQFTAPELLDFRNTTRPNFQTDMYSAGLILIQALTGKPPFDSAGYDHFYLINVIKEGRVFDWINAEAKVVLESNPQIMHVLDMMINQRADVESISEYIQNV